MISTEEAAKLLGVTKRRVQELLSSGTLAGEKTSGIWLVDESAVAERLRTANKKGGRPVLGKASGEAIFTLMNRGYEVAEVTYSKSRKEFVRVGSETDTARVPIGLADARGVVSLDEFNIWWRGRGIPATREGLAVLLDEAGVSLPQELLQRNLGLSLSDQYWICPKDSGLRWQDVNFFNNDFEQVSASTEAFAFDGKAAVAKPDNTSDGNLEKTWVCRDGVRVLLKSGTRYGQEPYNEVVATALFRRLLGENEYVPYSVEGEGPSAFSSCPNFLTDEEEFAPAFYVSRSMPRNVAMDDYEHYLACCEALGATGCAEALDRMMVCDDILANHDRHWRNFGLVRNVETLECRPAPIFDTGSSLWCDIPTSQLAAGEHSYESKQFYESPAKQMLLVRDMSWFNPKALDGFVDEAMGILSRNDALGERLPYIKTALEWRLGRMTSIAEWA